MRVLLVGLLLCLALLGCAAHGVRCEGPLQPINPRHTGQDVEAPAGTAHRTGMP
jgi:hypothetical protein